MDRINFMNDKRNDYNDIIRNMRSKSNADLKKMNRGDSKKYNDEFEEFDESPDVHVSHVQSTFLLFRYMLAATLFFLFLLNEHYKDEDKQPIYDSVLSYSVKNYKLDDVEQICNRTVEKVKALLNQDDSANDAMLQDTSAEKEDAENSGK